MKDTKEQKNNVGRTVTLMAVPPKLPPTLSPRTSTQASDALMALLDVLARPTLLPLGPSLALPLLHSPVHMIHLKGLAADDNGLALLHVPFGYAVNKSSRYE